MNLSKLTKHERNRFDFAVIADWIPPGERVLDLGCGDGALCPPKGGFSHTRMQNSGKTHP